MSNTNKNSAALVRIEGVDGPAEIDNMTKCFDVIWFDFRIENRAFGSSSGVQQGSSKIAIQDLSLMISYDVAGAAKLCNVSYSGIAIKTLELVIFANVQAKKEPSVSLKLHNPKINFIARVNGAKVLELLKTRTVKNIFFVESNLEEVDSIYNIGGEQPVIFMTFGGFDKISIEYVGFTNTGQKQGSQKETYNVALSKIE